ncbi:MAG: dipeptide epimerase, partial [Rhodospirillales bacterium]|nr:dipeptide epimerase [Rhodospirillales bacterium]
MAPHPQRLTVTRRAWPLARPLATPQGVIHAVDTVVAELSDGDSRGRGEGVPLPRFGESIESVVAALEGVKSAVPSGLDREALQRALPPGAARNALDCAFWAIEANRAYCSVADLAGLGEPTPVETALTLHLDEPSAMAELAAAHRTRPSIRLAIGGAEDLERIQAVRQAAPAARLIVDANEAWTPAQLREILGAARDLRIELIEQPLPVEADAALGEMEHSVPLCADESCRTVADLDRLQGRYQVVAVKLDKVGGLTAALALAAEARQRGFGIMLGDTIGTSLGTAPAMLLAPQADFVALDGPTALASDRAPGLRFDGGTIQPPAPAFWGG